MKHAFGLRAALAALLIGFTAWGFAQSPPGDAPKTKPYEPSVGQAGKDVIWVPSPDKVVDRMLQMAQTTPQDFVVDLGSGDGKIVIAAAQRYGARAMGVEFNPDMVALSRDNARKAGVTDKVTIVHGDFFKVDFSRASVLTLYLLPDLNIKLRPRILGLKPGTRVVSHSFDMQDWEPDELSILDGKRAYFWLVPANVAGRWSLALEGGTTQHVDIGFEQEYQKLQGYAQVGEVLAGLRDARLRGADIRFTYVDAKGVRRAFSGRVTGDRMQGEYRSDPGTPGRWRAVKR
ncbi:MAG TPA: class I SAM-dependent methyltransferase [Burkholderiales bacterium]|nr:class I SAM-dependent methyltransferase [Burkholderiales bacterium]